MIIVQQAPPTVTQHAVAWIMNQWNDPHRRCSLRRGCDDAVNPIAPHPDCVRVPGGYHEDGWLVYVSAQAMSPHDRVRVIVADSVYIPEYQNNNPALADF